MIREGICPLFLYKYSEEYFIKMPAKSKAQQRFFGMVRAAQKGEMDSPSPEVAQAASSMKKKDVKDFASTKHKKLPEKKVEEEYRNIARKAGAMTQKAAKAGVTAGAAQVGAHALRTGGVRNAVRQKLGLKPKKRDHEGADKLDAKAAKARRRAATITAVQQSHKPGIAQDQATINKEKGMEKNRETIRKMYGEEFDYLFEDLDVTTLTEEDIIDLIEKKIPSSKRAKIARAVADRLPPGRTSSKLRLYALEKDLEKQKGRKFTKADSRQGATSAPKNEMRTFQDFMAIIEAVDWDKSDIGKHTGQPIPKKRMSAAKRHEMEKERRANLGKKPGDKAGDSALVRAMRRKAQETGNYAN